ncbi:DNA helicase [Dinoroseobacter sp. S76]|uniref:DNA helicase n=1 Tax=Dinoroseobacter sp. S76 TaxID=3415124 RepID=UPI003C7A666D
MRLSAPIFALKRKARRMARDRTLPLHRALDIVAAEEGFQSWSHLAASATQASLEETVLSQLEPGALYVIAARPGQGKTRLGLELALMASRRGRQGHFFTLEYHERDIADLMRSMRLDPRAAGKTLRVDTSDDISADHIIDRLDAAGDPALAVVDYLQLLDQKRNTPDLETQIAALRDHAARTGGIYVFISQIDRAFEMRGEPMPGLGDLRLPNPLDLGAFHRIFFLHAGEMRSAQAA